MGFNAISDMTPRLDVPSVATMDADAGSVLKAVQNTNDLLTLNGTPRGTNEDVFSALGQDGNSARTLANSFEDRFGGNKLTDNVNKAAGKVLERQAKLASKPDEKMVSKYQAFRAKRAVGKLDKATTSMKASLDRRADGWTMAVEKRSLVGALLHPREWSMFTTRKGAPAQAARPADFREMAGFQKRANELLTSLKNEQSRLTGEGPRGAGDAAKLLRTRATQLDSLANEVEGKFGARLAKPLHADADGLRKQADRIEKKFSVPEPSKSKNPVSKLLGVVKKSVMGRHQGTITPRASSHYARQLKNPLEGIQQFEDLVARRLDSSFLTGTERYGKSALVHPRSWGYWSAAR